MVFVVNAFFQIPSSSFRLSRKEVENEEKNIDVSNRYKVSENCFKVSEKSGESQEIFNFLIRDGPLEKLWGGWGFFEPQEFFRYQIRCMAIA